MPLKDLPTDAQPREKLLARGPAALADAELLAILLRTLASWARACCRWRKSCSTCPRWTPQVSSVVALVVHSWSAAHQRCRPRTHQGPGPAKRAELVAVLELARRALASQSTISNEISKLEAFFTARTAQKYKFQYSPMKLFSVGRTIFDEMIDRVKTPLMPISLSLHTTSSALHLHAFMESHFVSTFRIYLKAKLTG